MKRFEFAANQIARVIEGHNSIWNYKYKEYMFNEKYTDAYSIRIPQGAVGIKAMLYSNDNGIKEEYDVVILHDDGKLETIFDKTTAYAQILAKRVQELENENNELRIKLMCAQSIIDSVRGAVA